MSYHYREVTNREIIVSIAICAVMLIIGFVIHGNIEENLMIKYQQYNTALQINNDSNMFKYGMSTNIGNAFVYGELKAINPVTYPEIGGSYTYVEKIKERYTKHTRTVTKTRTKSDGKTETYTEIEEYWTWDRVGSEDIHVDRVSFLDVEFAFNEFDIPSSQHIETIKESSSIRYVYYGVLDSYTGTLYAVLKDNTINNSAFYENMGIEETIDWLESNAVLVIFWIAWIILIVVCVIGFCNLENVWLEDKTR